MKDAIPVYAFNVYVQSLQVFTSFEPSLIFFIIFFVMNVWSSMLKKKKKKNKIEFALFVEDNLLKTWNAIFVCFLGQLTMATH